MKKYIDSYRRSINPPYTGKDTPVILGTLGVLALMVAFIVFGQQQRQEYARAVGTPAYLMMKIPPNNPARGLVYDGLEEDTTGVCKGLLKVKSNNPALEQAQCTHGPDPAPEGVDITKSVQTISENNKNKPVLGTSVTCDGDGVSGKRIQVIYARASDRADQYNKYLTSFQTWAADMDTIFQASAAETAGSRNVRFVHDTSCVPSVVNTVLSPAGDDSLSNTRTELFNQGFNRTDRKYLVFVDANIYCGIANLEADDQPGSTNANNRGPTIARVDNGCWGLSGNSLETHEITHTLGAVQLSAPNAIGNGNYHCTDEYDRMCETGPSRIVCGTQSHENRLDCNHDDYYSTNPPAGSYLATHWNTANNSFLISGIDATPTPTSTVPTATPTPTNTPTPTPIPSGDITKPTITITSPQSGTVVNRRANVTIAATASDNVAVDRVEFSVGGSLSIDYTAPYSYVWSVPGKPNASYIIKATAYDSSNNSSSQTITVTSSR